MVKTFNHSVNICPDCARGLHEHPGHDCKNLIPEGQCMCYHGAIAHNPDKDGVYHCWHYCLDHKESFRHSQAACDCHKNCRYLTFPMIEKEVRLEDYL